MVNKTDWYVEVVSLLERLAYPQITILSRLKMAKPLAL
jgi:hypothetical protein